MTQSSLNFAQDVNLPISGRSPRARQASRTGAVRASGDRPVLTMAYLALLRTLGPMSDQAAAEALGRGVSSINSIRHGLGEQVVDSGQWERSTFGTRRTKWMVKR